MKKVILLGLLLVLSWGCSSNWSDFIKSRLEGSVKVVAARNEYSNMGLAVYIFKDSRGQQNYWLVTSYVGKINLDEIAGDGPVLVNFFDSQDKLMERLKELAGLGFPYVPFVPDLNGQMSLDSLKDNTSDVPYYLIGHEQVKEGESVFAAQLLGTDKDSYLGEYTVMLLENHNLGLFYRVAFPRSKGMAETGLFMKQVADYYFQKIK